VLTRAAHLGFPVCDARTVPSLARAERAALLELLTDLGPDAPTLCEGWTTHDLAAHLVVRERRPHAVPGLVVPALHGITARLERRMRPTAYDDLLAALRSGPPVWSPVGLPDPLYDPANLHEFYVHHEDVRRLADPGPRAATPGLDDALWSRLRTLARVFTRRARGLGMTLATPDARSLRARSGPDEVVLRGTPRELFLWLWGRRSVADVAVEGPAGAVERLAQTRIGP
jgi:uncharacterized protein (TIGR03085 family)